MRAPPLPVFASVVCTLATSQLSAQASGERNDGWRRDAAAFVNALATQHYVLSRAPLPDSIRRAQTLFDDGIARWSDDRALAELMRIAAMAGDGHTYVLPFSAAHATSHWLPLRLYQFSDGMFVIDALPGYEAWIGARLDALGGVPVPQLVARLRPYIARDNDAGGILFASATLLRFQGFIEAALDRPVGDGVAATLRTRSGRDTLARLPLFVTPALRGMPKLIPSRLSTAPAPRWLRNVSSTFWFELIGDTVLYVQFNQVQDTPQESLAQAAARLGRAIDSLGPRLLIVDVRQNNGGNLGLLDPLIAVLRDFRAGQGHRLVAISGRHTFSAAEVFLARVEHEARAEVVGEPSASKPNFVGEENPVQLPYSGAIASVSNRYHESIPGDTRPWIEPHPKIFLSSTDYFANRDPVLEAILGAGF